MKTDEEIRADYQDRMLALTLAERGIRTDAPARPAQRWRQLWIAAAAVLVVVTFFWPDSARPAQDALPKALRDRVDGFLKQTFLDTPGIDDTERLRFRQDEELLDLLRRKPEAWPYVRARLPELERARKCGRDLPALISIWIYDEALRPRAVALLREEPRTLDFDHVVALAELGRPETRRLAEAQLRTREDWEKSRFGYPTHWRIYRDLYFIGRGENERIPRVRREMQQTEVQPDGVNTSSIYFLCAAYFHAAGKTRDWVVGVAAFDRMIEEMLRADEPEKNRVRRCQIMLARPMAYREHLSRGKLPPLAHARYRAFHDGQDGSLALKTSADVRMAVAQLGNL